MITIEQIRAARAMLGLKQADLAKKSGVSTGTINNIERGAQTDPKISTVQAIQSALEGQGIVFKSDATGTGIWLKASSQSTRTPTLLIIDDNATDRRLYKAWLRTRDDKEYDITEAGSAQEGYDAFVRHKPACIILDFMMYGKDGFQMLVEMKKEHTEIPPIIFVTAMHTDIVKKDALAMGVHAYLDKKTLTKEKLCEAVESALA